MLSRAFDYVPTVVVRSRKQMRAIVDGRAEGVRLEASRLSVRRDLPEGTAHGEEGDQGGAHEPGGRHVAAGTGVLYFSRLTAKATASRLGKIVGSPIYSRITIRNWNTTTRLMSLMDAAATSSA